MNAPHKISNVKYQISILQTTPSSIFRFAFCIFILFAVGCRQEDKGAELALQIEQLTQERAQLRQELEQSKRDNKQLNKQLRTLSGLPVGVRLENMYNIERIKLGRLSGFFDKDDDGKRETLIVYVTPYDKEGDGVKATGSMNVQLWNLNNPEDQALLGEWDVPPGELKKVWFKTILAVNYRLTFDISDKVEDFDEPLTAKVTFTDYLSGKVFKDQRVIEPR
jgi:outer membrane murein-binding lipoprotein Lpp